MRDRLLRIWQKLKLKARLAISVLSGYDDDPRRTALEISFSQRGEDLLSLALLRNKGIAKPSYVDIGANHPTKLSNTYLMYLLGGRGMNIEPDPDAAEAIRRARPEDTTINAGVAADEGERDFFIMSTNVANTFLRSEAEELERRDGNRIKRVARVPMRNLMNLLAEHSLVPDFMSLDVEGMDLEILQTVDWACCRPKVICVETIDYFTQKKNLEIVRLLAEQGYTLHADTFINSIFTDSATRPSS